MKRVGAPEVPSRAALSAPEMTTKQAPQALKAPEVVVPPAAPRSSAAHRHGGPGAGAGLQRLEVQRVFGPAQPKTGESNIILVGAPASGKGTQAKLLESKYGLVQISTGDLLRKAKGSPLGDEAATYMSAGKLVPDALVMKLLEQRLHALGTPPKGFILDGFPRTLAQAQGLSALLQGLGAKIDRVIVLEVPAQTVIGRISGRRSCGDCGEVYHLENKPPKKSGCCDKCDGPLIQREGDTVEKVKVRLDAFEAQTAKVIPFFERRGIVSRVDADRDSAEVLSDVTQILEPAPGGAGLAPLAAGE